MYLSIYLSIYLSVYIYIYIYIYIFMCILRKTWSPQKLKATKWPPTPTKMLSEVMLDWTSGTVTPHPFYLRIHLCHSHALGMGFRITAQMHSTGKVPAAVSAWVLGWINSTAMIPRSNVPGSAWKLSKVKLGHGLIKTSKPDSSMISSDF